MPELSLKYTHCIDTAHRLFNYAGKCRQIHGHRYQITVMIEGDCLDKAGMLVDFGQVKAKVGEWLDSQWDHRLLLFEDDPIADVLAPHAVDIGLNRVPFNPTAENMAAFLLDQFNDMFYPDRVVSVEVEETPPSRAIAKEGACRRDC